jgi:hypothetical protein
VSVPAPAVFHPLPFDLAAPAEAGLRQ